VTTRARGLGIEGEARAARLLEADGYSILARNARCDRVEIDLVAARGDTVAFVEVKTRRGSAHGAPEEAVDWRKRRRLVRGAAAWLQASGVRARQIRFDVIVCELDARGAWQRRHLVAAFDAEG
jgi:putative endonuclease